MKKLRAFYFTGTGNTRYVTEKLCRELAEGYETAAYEIAGKADWERVLGEADCVLLAFPVYGSSPPVPMRRFLFAHAAAIRGKDIIIAATQYMFSGDGAASLGRAAEKCGGRVVYAEHFRMPNNLADSKALKIRNGEDNAAMLARTDRRIERFARKILDGKACRRGFNPISHAVGYLCQRALWRRREEEKKSRLSVDAEKCRGCGACVRQCPVGNLSLKNGKACPQGDCALCYRCVNLCPERAITLVGKSAPEIQYQGPPRF